MPISDATREDAAWLVARYPVARSALLPLLHLVQAEEGYVSEDGVTMCAQLLGLSKAEVGAVSTFYTMYKREPVGDYLLSVCTNPVCKIAGGQAIYESYVEELGGAHLDEETGVMVEHAECLGICDAAPVVQINYEMYGPVATDEAGTLLTKAKAGDPPASNRSGTVPPTFRAVERELSGIDDGVDEHLIEAARLQAAAAVPPADRSGETDIPATHPGGDPAGHGGQAFATASGIGVSGGSPASISQRPEHATTAPAGPAQAEAAREVAEQETGAEAEQAEQAVEDEPAGDSPSVAEQPDLDAAAGDAPAESSGEQAEPQEAEDER